MRWCRSPRSCWMGSTPLTMRAGSTRRGDYFRCAICKRPQKSELGLHVVFQVRRLLQAGGAGALFQRQDRETDSLYRVNPKQANKRAHRERCALFAYSGQTAYPFRRNGVGRLQACLLQLQHELARSDVPHGLELLSFPRIFSCCGSRP